VSGEPADEGDAEAFRRLGEESVIGLLPPKALLLLDRFLWDGEAALCLGDLSTTVEPPAGSG